MELGTLENFVIHLNITGSYIQRLLLIPQDAAAALGISEKTLWSWTSPRGPIQAVRIGRSVRYAWKSLEKFVEQQQTAANDNDKP